MIKITINRNDNLISKVEISGHANSDKHGQDLVCAGVSAVAVGVLNTLVQYDFLKEDMGILQMKEGYINIEVKKHSKEITMILETLVTSLETITESNKKYIQIKTEV